MSGAAARIPLVLVGAAGRMGRLIAERALRDPRFRVAALVEHEGHAALGTLLHGTGTPRVSADLASALSAVTQPVVIEFALAEATERTLAAAAGTDARLVLGTTGHGPAQREAIAAAAASRAVLQAANMSTGITALLAHLPALAAALADFDARILEVHHTAKKDAPSGTALALGAALGGRAAPAYASLRAGSVPGIHTVFFGGAGEHIEITHRAEGRECFAAGALRAAAWIARQPAGLYSMLDVVRAAGA